MISAPSLPRQTPPGTPVFVGKVDVGEMTAPADAVLAPAPSPEAGGSGRGAGPMLVRWRQIGSPIQRSRSTSV